MNVHGKLQKLNINYIYMFRVKPLVVGLCIKVLRSTVKVDRITISKDGCVVDTGIAKFNWDPASSDSLLGYPLRGDFEKTETEVAVAMAKKSKMIVDVGGNFGWFACQLLNVMPSDGQIHIFEPVPQIRKELTKNIEINSRKDATVFLNDCCLSDVEGEVTMHVPKTLGSAFASLAAQDYKGGFDLVVSRAVTLDDYCKQNNIDHIDFLKIDVEGAEFKVLQGSQRMLSAEIKPVILLECFQPLLEPFGRKVADVVNFITELGYKGFVFQQANLIELTPENIGTGYDYLFVSERETLADIAGLLRH